MNTALALVALTIAVLAYESFAINEFTDFESMDQGGKTISCNELINFEESLSYTNDRKMTFVGKYMHSTFEYSQCNLAIEKAFESYCERYAGNELTARELYGNQRLFYRCPEFVNEHFVDGLSFETIKKNDNSLAIKVIDGGDSIFINPTSIASVKVSESDVLGKEIFHIGIRSNLNYNHDMLFITANKSQAYELQKLLALSIPLSGKNTQ